MTLLSKCIHVIYGYELGRKDVSLQRFKYVAYYIDGGKERKKIQLVTSQVQLCDFMKDFIKRHEKMFIMSKWLDGRTSVLEYENIHLPLVLSYQWLIFMRTTPFNRKMRFKSNIITQSGST
jgi:hypothetical protein